MPVDWAYGLAIETRWPGFGLHCLLKSIQFVPKLEALGPTLTDIWSSAGAIANCP